MKYNYNIVFISYLLDTTKTKSGFIEFRIKAQHLSSGESGYNETVTWSCHRSHPDRILRLQHRPKTGLLHLPVHRVPLRSSHRIRTGLRHLERLPVRCWLHGPCHPGDTVRARWVTLAMTSHVHFYLFMYSSSIPYYNQCVFHCGSWGFCENLLFDAEVFKEMWLNTDFND